MTKLANGTWNIISVVGKEPELVEELKTAWLDICGPLKSLGRVLEGSLKGLHYPTGDFNTHVGSSVLHTPFVWIPGWGTCQDGLQLLEFWQSFDHILWEGHGVRIDFVCAAVVESAIWSCSQKAASVSCDTNPEKRQPEVMWTGEPLPDPLLCVCSEVPLRIGTISRKCISAGLFVVISLVADRLQMMHFLHKPPTSYAAQTRLFKVCEELRELKAAAGPPCWEELFEVVLVSGQDASLRKRQKMRWDIRSCIRQTIHRPWRVNV